MSSLTAYWTLISPRTPTRAASASVRGRIRARSAAPERDRRQRARRVAGVDAGLLDVLHDAAEVELGAVVERVDVDLDGVLEEAVDQHRVLRADVGRLVDVGLERGVVVDDLHARGRRARRTGARAPGSRSRRRSPGPRRRSSPCRAWAPAARRRASTRPNAPRSSARSIASGDVPTTGTPASLSARGEAERRLPAELHDDADDAAGGALGLHDLEHVLEGERLEVEPVGGVVVGGDGLRVAVDHDGLVAGVAQREGRVHAGVVELDALPDPVRARSRG